MEEIDRRCDTAAGRTQRFLTDNGITQTEVAGWYRVDSSTISRKLARTRRWTEDEIKTFLSRASEKLGRPVFFEEAFGSVTEVTHGR